MRYVVVVDDSEWKSEDFERKNFKDEIRYALEDIYVYVESISDA